ncbi:peptidylprolyl isomerase [Paenibacillus camelliae]|uniref:peptidylprolyl isomerase n=1 Tax=Paenibacillus camelliae TaxID=512410 RepID=UPI00203AE3DA|nr:peptidylprolyl isomerase [Paenibacillus camelliae]MCM3635886.1 peptidylprolyl isomerase [Paenibacillus camelliae]
MLHKKTNKKINKYVMLLLTAVLCIGLLSACGKDDELNPGLTFADVEGGEVVATYKDGSVTDKEFNKFKSALALTQGMDPSILDMEGYREYILEQYIVYKVLAGKATEEQQTEAKDEALANFTQFEEILKGSGDVNEQLKSYDLTRNDVATFLTMGSAVSKYIDSQITDEMMKTEYEDNKADYSLYDVRQIVINLAVPDAETGETKSRTEEEALALAQEVKTKLDAGGSWDELAKQYSDDATKDSGGVYTDYMGGRWYEPVKEAAYTQELNTVGDPVLSPIGYHILMVEGRDVLEYDAVAQTTKDMIRYVLSNTVMDDFMNKELPEYEINITLPPVNNAEPDAAEGTEEAGNEPSTDEAANEESTDGAESDSTSEEAAQ